MDQQLLKIESYSKAFAEKICNSFFINKEEINGEQILSLTSIEQVNLFVLKNLFERWLDESYKLRSPYFDYDHSEVKEGMQQFMNVLSRHILIKREFFRPLLENATYETLTLLLEPSLYLKTELGRDGYLIIQDFKSKKKFYKLYKNFWDRINNSNKESISIEELQKDIEADKSVSISEEYIAKFSSILPFEILKPVVNKNESLASDLASISVQKNEVAVSSPIQKPEVDSAPPIVEEKHIPLEPVVQLYKEDKKINEPTVVPSVNEKFSSSQMTINDVLAQNQSKTVADQIGKRKLDNIRSGISLNQKFQFINYLFLGQSSDYENALNEVERCSTFEQALTLLNQNYAARYHWDYNKPEVSDFIKLIEQKFV